MVAVAREDRRIVLVAQREMDVARVALALVVLRHEREAHTLLGGDLLRAELEQTVLVGLLDERVVLEGDLVLTEVALTLHGFDDHAGRAHRTADPPEQGLDARRALDGIVDVVLIHRRHVAVARVPGLFVGVFEDDELELGAGDAGPAALFEALDLREEDLARRRGDGGAVHRLDVGEDDDGLVVPRHQPGGTEVGFEREVAVPPLPRRQREAVDRAHVDVRGEEIAAPLDDASANSSKKYDASRRLPCTRPCMSVMATMIVSISPVSTSSIEFVARWSTRDVCGHDVLLESPTLARREMANAILSSRLLKIVERATG